MTHFVLLLKPFLWACLLLVSVNSALAASTAPFLWRLDSSPPAYLFGTIHSAHPALNRLPDSVHTALAQSDRFYGELALDSDTQWQVMALFQHPAGSSLLDQLDPERVTRANMVLTAIDPALSVERLAHLKLWAFTLNLALIEDQLTYAGQPMMDQRLYDAATAAGKTTGGLETPQEQAAVFERLSPAEQLELFDATLAYLEQTRADGESATADSYRVYLQGDPNAFTDLFGEQMDVSLLLKLKLERLLLKERNKRMARRIERLLSEHPDEGFFFAVGAAHFAEPGGLLSLLRQRGYRITRVSR